MKTNIFSSQKATLYSLIGFLSVVLTSCGSYQNSSYYDNDGIYGGDRNVAQSNASNHYKEYFNSLQNENNTLNDTVVVVNQDYPDWGNNSKTTAVNVYTNPWSLSIGFGFGYGYPYYGYGYGYPYYDYGYGYPYYGYGYGYPYYGYGWGNPYYGGYYPYYGYGYNNNYSYNSSRRGSSYGNRVDSGRYPQSQTNANRASNYNNYNNVRRGSNSTTRNSSQFMTRDYSQNNSNYNSTRTTRANPNTTTNSSRNQNYTPPTRSYDSGSNSNNNSNYNSGSGRSSGGGYNGGGSTGGGGRSSGGGGRR